MKSQGKVIIIIALLFLCKANIHAQLPQVYDLRVQNLISPVKDQGNCGSCWAFATIAAIESNWLKKGFSLQVLSEDNLLDCHGFDESPCFGGSFYMSHALLSRYGGPLRDSDDPYTPFVSNCTNNLPSPPIPPAFVEEIRFLPKDNQIIKQAIFDNGALATAMFFNPANFDSNTFKYYDSSLDANDSLYPHCVTLAGWNDNMTFPGAPGAGGWIIKDSYGTSWADNGYFYVSYHDAGILSETVYFPGRQEKPASPIKPIVYYHDKLGWVDNFGFNSHVAYGLVKYTLSPTFGAIINQQIKRIGTYAVEDNTNITIEIYKSFESGVLSDFVASGSVYCPYKGFYTIPFNLGTELLGQEFFVKGKYVGPASASSPIPIEIFEPQHTTGITLSSNSCYVSSDGNNWVVTGQGSALSFDLCIKMYAVDAPLAQIQSSDDSFCEADFAAFFDASTPAISDSVQWFFNEIYQGSQPVLNIHLTSPGTHEVKLVAHLSGVSDTTKKEIQVNPLPFVPTITQSGDTLYSSSANSYQWYDSYGPLSGETNNYFVPQQSGQYYVGVSNEFQCTSFSDFFDFELNTSVDFFSVELVVFPNPFNNEIIVSSGKFGYIDRIIIYDVYGKQVFHSLVRQENEIKLSLIGIVKGIYFIEIHSGEKVIKKKIIAQ